MIVRAPSILSRFKRTTQIGALTIVAVRTTSMALLVLAYAELQSDIEQRADLRRELKAAQDGMRARDHGAAAPRGPYSGGASRHS